MVADVNDFQIQIQIIETFITWKDFVQATFEEIDHTDVVNRIGSVIVSVLASSAVDRGFEPRSGQTKDYEIGICCFSAKHAALRRKSKD